MWSHGKGMSYKSGCHLTDWVTVLHRDQPTEWMDAGHSEGSLCERGCSIHNFKGSDVVQSSS